MTARLRLLRVTTLAGRARGLLFRRPLRRGIGLWLIPCWAIHTVGMRASLDVAFLDRQGRVLKLVRQLKPWRLALCLRAVSVIEFQAGSIDVEYGGVRRIEAAVQHTAGSDVKRGLQEANQFSRQPHSDKQPCT